MAFEADCGLSTVLDAFCVASTAGFLVPGECRASAAARDTPQSGGREGAFRRGSSSLKTPILRGDIARECPL